MSDHKVEVIGAGWGRTGTSSFKKALEILGYNPTYHMVEVIENNHVQFWQRVLDGKPYDFQEVFDGKQKYRATCDFPSAQYWREQLKRYPDAKVILTAREPEKWFKSCTQTIFCASFNSPYTSFWVKVALWLGIPRPGFGKMVSQMFGVATGGSWEKDKVIASYVKHVEDVKRECPPEQLLVFDVTEGWEPLCKFLNKPVPNVPFPHVNDTAEFQRMLTGLMAVGYISLAGSVVIPAVAGYYLLKFWGFSH